MKTQYNKLIIAIAVTVAGSNAQAFVLSTGQNLIPSTSSYVPLFGGQYSGSSDENVENPLLLELQSVGFQLTGFSSVTSFLASFSSSSNTSFFTFTDVGGGFFLTSDPGAIDAVNSRLSDNPIIRIAFSTNPAISPLPSGMTFNNVVLNAVPEPTSALLGSFGGLLLLRRKRKI